VIEVPQVVRNKAMAAGAARWLDELPDLIADLELKWSFRAGRRLAGATESYVAEATCADGTAAVLKLRIPGDPKDTANEISVLRLAGGRGCARLYNSEVANGALLMERLGRSLYQLKIPIGRRHAILCSAATAVWQPAPDSGLPTGAAKGRWLIDFITTTWQELDRPCSERAIDYAIACARRRIAAHDDERSVVVHGDLHQWNTLEAADGFKLIDPDGLLAEAEYDLGIIMREDPVELLRGDPWERARTLATRTRLDATAIWEWGAVERVSTGLLCSKIDLQPVGRDMLAAADRVSSLEAGNSAR
jgi:streptomycin 6-kinase